MRRRFSEFGMRLIGRKHLQQRYGKDGFISRHTVFAKRLRVEPLEDRRMLSVAGSSEALEVFHTQDALFAENAGQWTSDEVYFGYNKGGTQIYFTDDSLEFGLSRRELKDGVEAADIDLLMPGEEEEAYDYTSTHFSLSFDGAQPTVPVGDDMAETVLNYHLGEQSAWVDGVATYKTVVYNDLYDGIDLHTFSQHGQMKYEFHISPGSDYSRIELSYDGIEGLSIADDGSLHIATELGDLVDEDLYIYQVVDGQEVEVSGRFVLLDEDSYAFSVSGQYDANFELVIDPNLDWSTYLGGSSYDWGYGIAVDPAGNELVTGYSRSSGWTSGGYNTILIGSTDAFVAKLSPTGTHLWSTYMGGGFLDHGYGIAVDPSGNVLVTGKTKSGEWASGGFDTSHCGSNYYDAFVAKLSGGGAHLWSTYIGNTADDYGYGIAVDPSGNVLVTGMMSPSATRGYAFVYKLSGDGALIWNTYWNIDLGVGSGYGIAVDPSGNVLVTGSTSEPDWTSGGYDTSFNGSHDAFVVKFSSDGVQLWSTYMGGSDNDYGRGIAVDPSGNVLVTGKTEVLLTGNTESADWTSGGYDTIYSGNSDAFVAKLNSDGAHLWSTFMGGSDSESGYGIAVDPSSNVLVTGGTYSPDWIAGGHDTIYSGNSDAFVAKLSGGGVRLWSTYLGGTETDYGQGIAVDSSGNVLVTGRTSSPDWTAGGYDTSHNGSRDAFVAKINDVTPVAILKSNATVAESDVTFSVTYSDNVAISSATIGATNILVTGPNGYSQYAAIVSIDDDTDASPRIATYRVTSPGGQWIDVDDGTYQIEMVADQVSDTSGNFVPAGSLGDFVIAIGNPPLPGDANGDGSVDVADLGILATNYGTSSGAEWGDGDFTDDGMVDVADLGILATNYGTSSPELLPGDATCDGSVDVADLGILATNYGTSSSAEWGDGDFTGDGLVDVSDLGLLATNYGTVAVSTSSTLATASAATSSTAATQPEAKTVPCNLDNDGRVRLGWETGAGTIRAKHSLDRSGKLHQAHFPGSNNRVTNDDVAILAQHWMMAVEDMGDDDNDERDVVFATVGSGDDMLGLLDK